MEFKGATECAYPFVHSRQASAKCLIRRESDAIVGYFDGYLRAFDSSLHPHCTCVGVPENVRDGFLNHAVDRLRKQAIEASKSRIDRRGDFQAGDLYAGIL